MKELSITNWLGKYSSGHLHSGNIMQNICLLLQMTSIADLWAEIYLLNDTQINNSNVRIYLCELLLSHVHLSYGFNGLFGVLSVNFCSTSATEEYVNVMTHENGRNLGLINNIKMIKY